MAHQARNHRTGFAVVHRLPPFEPRLDGGGSSIIETRGPSAEADHAGQNDQRAEPRGVCTVRPTSMGPRTSRFGSTVATAANPKCTRSASATALGLLCALSLLAATPGTAPAHGLATPVATSYPARVSRAPAGLDAEVVDGDLRMWLRVPASMTALVMDYLGAPCLRFSRSGVQVNHNSWMYYLNQTPVPATAPLGLSRTTAPDWQQASSAHDYNWHDGCLHALATIALSPGTRYVGRWSTPVLIDGRPSSISGAVWHAANPSIVWFWPIVVLFLCVVAAWRIRRPALDARLARCSAS
jgi:hypothetical protein